MSELGPVAWPPAPIRTERLTLRATEACDRGGFIDLHASAEVMRYLGGPTPRDEFEGQVGEVPAERTGSFAVEVDGTFIGWVELKRRGMDVKVHLPSGPGELELGYLFLPTSWGKGYAFEATRAVLAWGAEVLPGEPVVLLTQTANAASMRLAERLGFVKVTEFENWGAQQWFGVLQDIS